MKLKYFIGLFYLLLSLSGKAQISAYSDYIGRTDYPNPDSIFIFCTDDENGASLIAADSTGDGHKKYRWYNYNIGTNDFTEILSGISYNIDSTTSTIVGLSTGGYKVIIGSGAEKQQYLAWVYNTTDRSVEIILYQNTCWKIILDVDPYESLNSNISTNLITVDTLTSIQYPLYNSITNYEWSADTDISINTYPSPRKIISGELPLENTIFKVIVTDRFGCTVEDTLNYEAIATKAQFSWRAYDEDYKELSSGDQDGSISEAAPLKVEFTNESKNGNEYLWGFKDPFEEDDTLRTTDLELEPSYRYFYTNKTESGKTYTMWLKSINYNDIEVCDDSITFEINLKPVSIEFPNVFTPNGDGINDVFLCDSLGDGPISVQEFKITIFNRAGQVVHEYQGSIFDWEGWDGKVKNSNREATEGNYYFVVEVLGWDKKLYDNYDYAKSGGSDSEGGGDKPTFGLLRLYR